MMKNTVPNKSLQFSEIPSPEADYFDISEFALTFDGYEFPDCAEMANSHCAYTLSEMRAVLFFEQRRFRHFGYYPTGEDLEYIKTLIQEIRTKVEIEELE
jgi:hypothetical protein